MSRLEEQDARIVSFSRRISTSDNVIVEQAHVRSYFAVSGKSALPRHVKEILMDEGIKTQKIYDRPIVKFNRVEEVKINM